ncbi:MAG: ATP-binding response regulator, partial [Anaerolineae bacterium]
LLAVATTLIGQRHPLFAALLLVAGQYVLATVTSRLFPGSGGLLLFLPIATASVLIWPWASLLAALLSCLALSLTHVVTGAQPYFALWIGGYCTAGAALFLSSESTRHTLLWAWRRHSDALELAEQLRDRQGELNRTIKALDLAYRLLQRTNHELAEARQEADEARRLKEQFAANIAHELRTPLNVILGFSEMMHLTPEVYGEAGWTPQVHRDIAQIYTASRHLLQLVDDVLDLSRLNTERATLRKDLCDLSQLVQEVVETAGQLVRDRPIRLKIDLDPAVPRLLLDATRMRQALFNLLNNAIRFTDEGEITVRSQRREDGVLVTVSDTGVGIPEGELESIFDEFYQPEGSAVRAGKGIGLGLAIARRFVQMHGGRIWAESPPTGSAVEVATAPRRGGRGSTFSMLLPLGDRRVSASRLRTSTPAPLPGNPYAETVLLVGAGRDVARLLEHRLGSASETYRVLRTTGAEQTRLLAGEHHARAVVCNLSLAGLRSLAAELVPRNLPRQTPVIWTAIPCAAWRAERMGVYASLQKPVERSELLGLLRGLPQVQDILIVDDDLPFSTVMARMLQSAKDEGHSYQVRSAYTGVEGLEEMRRRRPDVVLLDLLMPGIDGTAVLAAMRADPSLGDIPVIVVTAGDPEEGPEMPGIGLVALAQCQGWSLGNSLSAISALVGLARAEYGEAEAAGAGQPD